MAGPKQKLVWWLQYAALRFVRMLLGCFPIDLNLATARVAGGVLYRLDKRHRKIAIENLRASFPDLPQAKIEWMARESFRHMIQIGVEVLCMPRLINFDSFERYAELGPGLDEFIRLVASDQPMILVGGHFGNWEVGAFILAEMGFPTVSIGRPLDNPYLDRHIQELREACGQRILSKHGMTGQAIDLLERGHSLAFPADQDAGSRGFFVPFFGRPASVYRSIAYLSLETGTPIAVGGAYRLGRRFRYRGVVTDIIDPTEYEAGLDAAVEITRRYTAALEELVRHAPEQYLWVHRRWKSKPRKK